MVIFELRAKKTLTGETRNRSTLCLVRKTAQDWQSSSKLWIVRQLVTQNPSLNHPCPDLVTGQTINDPARPDRLVRRQRNQNLCENFISKSLAFFTSLLQSSLKFSRCVNTSYKFWIWRSNLIGFYGEREASGKSCALSRPKTFFSEENFAEKSLMEVWNTIICGLTFQMGPRKSLTPVLTKE